MPYEDSPGSQQIVLSRLVADRDWQGAYRYIYQQSAYDPAISGEVRRWLEAAQTINRPGSVHLNGLKAWVWRMNDAASRAAGKGPVSDARNQQVSDTLARDVANYYLRYLDARFFQKDLSATFDAQKIFDLDVASAVDQLELSETQWAGGLLGLAYGFDVLALGDDNDGIFNSIDELKSWMDQAVQVLDDNFWTVYNGADKRGGDLSMN